MKKQETKKAEAPSQTKEEAFLELCKGCKDKKGTEDTVLMLKGNIHFFERDSKREILFCGYHKVWSVFKTQFKMSNEQIQVFLKEMFKKHFKIEGLTPMATNW